MSAPRTSYEPAPPVAVAAVRYARHRMYRASDPRPGDRTELSWWKSDTYAEHYGAGAALIGAPGYGKSTLARLALSRLPQPAPPPRRRPFCPSDGHVNPLFAPGSRYLTRPERPFLTHADYFLDGNDLSHDEVAALYRKATQDARPRPVTDYVQQAARAVAVQQELDEKLITSLRGQGLDVQTFQDSIIITNPAPDFQQVIDDVVTNYPLPPLPLSRDLLDGRRDPVTGLDLLALVRAGEAAVDVLRAVDAAEPERRRRRATLWEAARAAMTGSDPTA